MLLFGGDGRVGCMHKRIRMDCAASEPASFSVLHRKLAEGAWEIRPMLPGGCATGGEGCAGLTFRPFAADGNCLFRAVADQVYADPDMCDLVREQTCDFEASFRDKFAQFVVCRLARQ